MSIKAFFKKILSIFDKGVYNSDWRCLSCGKEIFENQKICDDCLKQLPYNDKYICYHCGRQTVAPEQYCTTCKGNLTALDKCRSFFVYKKPISTMIMRLKYGNQRYLVEYFAGCLAKIYLQNYFNADGLVYVPMTKKDFLKRGYNQSKLLAESLSNMVNVPVLDCLVKKIQTKRQATLTREQRIKNLKDAFKVANKNLVKDKTLVIIDDVSTTGATAQAIAEKLKNAGAKNVYLISVASTPPIDKY